MRISDWSSDVCSADLLHLLHHRGEIGDVRAEPRDEVDDRPEFGNRSIDEFGAGVELFARARRQQLRLVGRICALALIGLQAVDIFLEPAAFADLARPDAGSGGEGGVNTVAT